MTPDDSDRIADFFSRHGGPGTRAARAGEGQEGTRGWSEIFAADGYCLRCDWSRVGLREEMQYREIAPVGLG